jgi:hypothetical protein
VQPELNAEFNAMSDDASLRPRLSTVSIIPGMDARAPERTDTSSGLRDREVQVDGDIGARR